MIEVLSRNKLDSPQRYSNRFSEIFVDTPLYHRECDFAGQDNTANFHNKKTDLSDTPVISQDYDDGILDYSPLERGIETINEEFESIAIRIFVPSIELTDRQMEQLIALSDQLSGSDTVFLDVLRIEAGIGQVYKNAESISSVFEDNRIFLLNAFNPHNRSEDAHNYGPLFARRIGISGYGDYMLERREMPDGNPRTQNRIIRYYIPDEFKRTRIRGKGYDSAASNMVETTYVSPSHCDYCRKFLSRVNHNRASCKEFQMGHYVQSMRDHLIEMRSYPPEDLDMDGHNNLIKKLGIDNNEDEEGVIK